jgi:uncharacterized membrane protein
LRNPGLIALSILSLGVAGYALVVYGFFPLGVLLHPDMRATYALYPAAIYAHIFGSAVALIIGPFQFWSRLRNERPQLHRWLGRCYLLVGVGIGGSTGLFMAFHAFGGVPARLGFGVLAVLWLYTGYRAYRAIRARDIAAHRRWMVRNFALTFAAVTLRLYLPTAMVSGSAFEPAYIAVAWLCWVPNLIAAELIFNRPVRQSTA